MRRKSHENALSLNIGRMRPRINIKSTRWIPPESRKFVGQIDNRGNPAGIERRGYLKFCKAQTLPPAVSKKPQATWVYLVLDMFL